MLIIGAAMAADLISAVDAPVDPGPRNGNWHRAFPDDAGAWTMMLGISGSYAAFPLSADLEMSDTPTLLSTRSDLQDHGVARCPDGSWLHAGSRTIEQPNDSAYATRVGADLSIVAEAVIEEKAAARGHNDLPVVCGRTFQGVAFSNRDGHGSWFFPLGADAKPGEPVELEGEPTAMGGSMLEQDGTLLFVSVPGPADTLLRIHRYDEDFGLMDSAELPLDGLDGLEAYWPQGLLAVGDRFVVAHVVRQAGLDHGDGNIVLRVLSADFQLLESHQVTDYALPDGGMRPSLTAQDDRLLITWDKAIHPWAAQASLSEAFVAPGGDSGDSGEGRACGCREGSASAFLPLLLLFRRRATRG